MKQNGTTVNFTDLNTRGQARKTTVPIYKETEVFSANTDFSFRNQAVMVCKLLTELIKSPDNGRGIKP